MHTRLGIWFFRHFAGLLALSIGVVTAVILAERALPATDGCLAVANGTVVGQFDLATGRWDSPISAEAARTNAQFAGFPSIVSPDGKYEAYFKHLGKPQSFQAALVIKPTGSSVLPQQETIVQAPLPEPNILGPSIHDGTVDLLWLPDSSGIIYRWEDQSPNEIAPVSQYFAVSSINGQEKAFRHLTVPAGTRLLFDKLSADSRYVTLISGSETDRGLNLWAVNDLQPVTTPISLPQAYAEVAWSPQGNWLAYWVVDTPDSPTLVLYNVGENKRLIFPSALKYGMTYWLDWSPDGRYVSIAFSSDMETAQASIFGVDDSIHGTIFGITLSSVSGLTPPPTAWMQKAGGHTLLYTQLIPEVLTSTFDLITFDPESQESRTLLTGLDQPPDTQTYSSQPEGPYLFLRWIKNNTTYAGVLDTNTGSPVTLSSTSKATTVYGKQVLALGWSPAGYAIAMTATSIVWARPDGTQRHQMPFDRLRDIYQDLYDGDFTPSGRWLLLRNAPVGVLNLMTGEYRPHLFNTTLPLPYTPFAIAQLPDTILRWLWDQQNSALILQSTDLNSDQSHQTPFSIGKLGSMFDLMWSSSPDGSKLAFIAPGPTNQQSILTVITNQGEIVRQYAPFIQSHITWTGWG